MLYYCGCLCDRSIFGGYCPLSWNELRGGSCDTEEVMRRAFIYTLENPHGIPACKISPKPTFAMRACLPSVTYGAVFGNGCDLGLLGVASFSSPSVPNTRILTISHVPHQPTTT